MLLCHSALRHVLGEIVFGVARDAFGSDHSSRHFIEDDEARPAALTTSSLHRLLGALRHDYAPVLRFGMRLRIQEGPPSGYRNLYFPS